MINNLTQYNSQINEILERKDFVSLLSLFTSNSVSPTELLVFYKQRNSSKVRPKKPIFKIKEYWTSNLPHLHLDEILESDIKVTFIRSYFSENDFCNPELNKHLLFIAQSDFIKHFKLWKVFNHSHFLTSVKQLAQTNKELEKFVKEVTIIIKAEKKINLEEKADEQYFLQFSLGEVMLAFTLYHYEFKQQPNMLGNKRFQTSIEVALAEKLDYIFNLFKGKPNINFQFPSNKELQIRFKRNEAPHKILGKKDSLPTEPIFQFLYRLINRLIEHEFARGGIQLYLSGYIDFENVNLNPAMLKSNNNYRSFEINDRKGGPEGFYFSNLSLDFSKSKLPSRIDITTSNETFKFYGIPDTFESNTDKIEMRKAFQLLQYFSAFKGPIERAFFPNGSNMIMNQGDSLFIELFGSNESISIFDYDELLNNIIVYFKWTIQEAKSTLTFLTLDLTMSHFTQYWLSKPFLKLNNQVIWLGSFAKDRRWDSILLNRLKVESENRSLVNIISKNFELRIEGLFKDKSFKTICGLPFKSSNGQSGDFDVLAFKDGYLFVCEAKTGIRTNDFHHASYTEAVKLEGEAAEQLEKGIFNIKEDWKNIRSKLGLNDGLELDSIKIIPIILTDFFEGDLKLYKKAIRKISLVELDVILNNKKKNLLQVYELLQISMNSHNQDYKKNRNSISNWDLWEGKKEFKAELLIKNIEENSIWKEMETIWKFEERKFWMNY